MSGDFHLFLKKKPGYTFAYPGLCKMEFTSNLFIIKYFIIFSFVNQAIYRW